MPINFLQENEGNTGLTYFQRWGQSVIQELLAIQAEERRIYKEEYACPKYLIPHKNITNVAVTGPSGVGKSTLINLLRGVKPGDKDEAGVGLNECTSEPAPYQFRETHSFCGKVQLWDLPGAGTTQVPKEDYIQNMGIRWFDVCIVVGAIRVREEEEYLMNEMERTKVRFLYVRTRMDTQVDDDKGRDPKETFEEVRDSLVHQSSIKRPYLIGRKFITEKGKNNWQNKDYLALQEDLRTMVVLSAKENNKPFYVSQINKKYD